jgi:hypothetical protein
LVIEHWILDIFLTFSLFRRKLDCGFDQKFPSGAETFAFFIPRLESRGYQYFAPMGLYFINFQTGLQTEA